MSQPDAYPAHRAIPTWEEIPVDEKAMDRIKDAFTAAITDLMGEGTANAALWALMTASATSKTPETFDQDDLDLIREHFFSLTNPLLDGWSPSHHNESEMFSFMVAGVGSDEANIFDQLHWSCAWFLKVDLNS